MAASFSRRRSGSTAARRKSVRRPEQLGIERAYRGRGGPRPGAGRKRGPGRRKVAHRRRPEVRRDCPLHVTLRLAEGLPRLRKARAFRRIRAAIGQGHRAGFAVVHFSVMSNHLHLIVEARDKAELSAGMKGLKVRIAKQLNRIWERKGTVFAERYHAVELSTPTQVRNGLCYVLNNARKHGAQHGRRYPGRWVDPFSSARQFDGWRQRVRGEVGEVRPPQSWLLRVGWRRRGLLDAHAVPGAVPGAAP